MITAPDHPRFSIWKILLAGLWLLGAISLALTIVWDFNHLNFRGPAYPGMPDPFAYITVDLIFSLWAAVGVAGLAVLTTDPFQWVGSKRIVWGGLALGLALGRVFSGWLDFIVGWFVPIWVTALAAPLVLIGLGVVTIIIVTAVVAGIVGVFFGIPATLFNQIVMAENALHIARYKQQGLSGYISRFGLWLTGQFAPPPPDDAKGARFATQAEIVAIHHPNDRSAMAFGHRGNPVFLKTDKHVLIMASTRSGKGVTLIIPHLLRYQGSAFVLDPKGENARATYRRRSTLNHKVHVLDPFGITGLPQARFNPLSRFTPATMEADSKALAAALFVFETERDRDHWSRSGQQLLALVIMFVYLSPSVPRAHKDLNTVRRTLLGSLTPAFNAMVKMDDANGLVRDLATSFLKTPERELASIVSTAQRQTEILDNPFITACLAASGPGEEVDFKSWKSGTMSVYLCLSAPKFPVFNRWLRLVLTSALDEMTETLDPPPLPVCFMLDELATLGHMAPVENAIGLAAGYGIQLVTVFQDTAQMRDLYKGRWASFIGNAGVRALFNLDDHDTAEYWSKTIGSTLMETRSTQENQYGQRQDGANIGEAVRRLLPSDKLMMDFAAGKMLVLAQGAHPFTTDRVPYWSDTALTGIWDDPRVKPTSSVSGSAIPPSAPTPTPPSPPKPAPAPASKSGATQSTSTPAPAAAPFQATPFPVNTGATYAPGTSGGYNLSFDSSNGTNDGSRRKTRAGQR